MNSSISFHYLLKYIIIGDSAVGKSNLLLRFTQDKFFSKHQITIGSEFGAKNIQISDKIYRIQIWDTAGQENFRSITRAYYKNCACVLIVYDISKKSSFNSLNAWIEECKNHSSKSIMMILVGNKFDLGDRREVTYEEGLELAKKNQMLFYETSAKTGVNVDQVFNVSSKEIAKKIDSNFYDLTSDSCGIKQGRNTDEINSRIMLFKNTKPRKKGCCSS